MCGIVGYVGGRSAQDVVIEGLRRMEYRGYDSAGIALVQDGGGPLAVDKRAGKLANLEKAIDESPLPHATTGIGHTRWARSSAKFSMIPLWTTATRRPPPRCGPGSRPTTTCCSPRPTPR